MKQVISLWVFALAIAFLAVAGTSYAGRDPTPDETDAVREALSAHGCETFGDVRVEDNGTYDVMDVVCSDGKRYDLTLDEHYSILNKVEDKD